MADRVSAQTWLGRATFLALACLVIFIQLLPLDTRPEVWPAPDVLLVVTLTWAARRPAYAPVYLIAAVFLLTDLLFQRPPGLWAALVVILSEMLRTRALSIRNMPLLLEWGSVAAGIVAITLANRMVLAIVMTPQAPLGMTLIQMVLTIAIYPLVVIIAHYVFGVSRPAPGQTNALGHRL